MLFSTFRKSSTLTPKQRFFPASPAKFNHRLTSSSNNVGGCWGKMLRQSAFHQANVQKIRFIPKCILYQTLLVNSNNSVDIFRSTYQATYHRSSIRWSKHSPARKACCDGQPDGSDRGVDGDHYCYCYHCWYGDGVAAAAVDSAEVGVDFCTAMSGATLADGGQ